MSVENEQPIGVDAESDGEAPSTEPAGNAGDEASSDAPAGGEHDGAVASSPAEQLELDGATISDDPGPPVRATMPAGDIGRAHLKGLIEALVFVSDRPVSLSDIAKSAGKADRKVVRSLVDELRQDYRSRGIHLEEVAGGLIFRTNPEYGPFIRDAAAKKPVKMSRAQLEALAIIAYRQPLTRPEVDEIRGVDSGPVMKMLLDRDLVRILGKKDEPGRPLLYGTTAAFLEFFGLKSLKDLPSLREFTELSDDSRKVFDREMTDEPVAADAETLAAAASAVTEGAPAPRPEDFEDPPTNPRSTVGVELQGSDVDPETDPSPSQRGEPAPERTSDLDERDR